MDGAEPGRPLPETTVAPATLPCSACAAFDCGTGRSATRTWVTSKGSLVRCVAPATPVTTISDSEIACGVRRMSATADSPSDTVTVVLALANPIRIAFTVYVPAGTRRIRYFPFACVSVPRPLPSMLT